MFTDDETDVLDASFDRTRLPSRLRNVVLGAFMAVGMVLGLYAFHVGSGVITAFAVFYVGLTSLEKASYLTIQRSSRGTIRKLVRRIERLEGVPQTPDEARPSVNAVDASQAA